VVAADRSRGGSCGWGRAVVVGGEAQRPCGEACTGSAAVRVYGRVSTEDWQDPVTLRARQLQQALMLAAGAGVIVAEFFDTGESRGPC
jgi:site-specific DNA recombinase